MTADAMAYQGTTNTGAGGSEAGHTVDALAVNTIRFLAADMVEAAGSGHPGMPMGAAPMAWTLWSRHLRHDPSDARWPDRDRFVLSAGHGSALHYSLLHLFGYDLPQEQLQRFRQLGSSTPGHPEFGHTDGVETTTGPLGQGLAMAVGLALAERMQAARFPEVTDHRTYAIVGDGCLMEGVSHEAASLAGHLRLGRLVVLWDDNDITIDGPVSRSCSDDQLARFAACGWHVLSVEDGTDVEVLDAAITTAKADPRPSFIAVRTVIGHGAPGIEGTSKAHGSPLGADVLAQAKAAARWVHEPFSVPAAVADRCAEARQIGARVRSVWRAALDDLVEADPERADAWRRTWERRLPTQLPALLDTIPPGVDQATRQSSQTVLKVLTAELPELVGGSADLAGSTGTVTGQRPVTADDFSGSVVHFGIREFAMAAVLNGLSLHGGFRPYGSTFLVFSDYLRPALRLSALMRQPVVYILTHDSVAVGEDGPTHQPVEHIESLRLIPGVTVLRPADDLETTVAWQVALAKPDGPTVLVLSRQSLPSTAHRSGETVSGLARLGARVIRAPRHPQVELLATGSEVSLALDAADVLDGLGLSARVVSVLDRDRFATRAGSGADEEGNRPLRISLEAGVTSGWLGLVDHAIGLDRFGASGTGADVMEHFGFTAHSVAERVQRLHTLWVGGPAPKTQGA